ncbi:MAG TPA: TetR/AcrR family transcriptional regulator [Acidimicrobiales bacterium]|nr:TetR/AcrR family transcriptional regulator [Acidimicrobiales bacterium]
MPARRGNVGDPTARNAVLDAAQKLMLEEGYASVTARRVAALAKVNSALVFYYFETMDGLFIALFQRGAERSFERLQDALSSAQPLWGFWDSIHDRSGSALTMEFIALANHRKAIRAEIADYSRRFRREQLETLSSVLAGYGLDPELWPAASTIVALSGISRFLLIEEAFDVDIGHAETVALIEERIRALEGDRAELMPNEASTHG